MNWYYESSGQQQGPVPETELDRLLAEGKISQDTLVWREGMAGWTPLRTARPSASPAPPVPGVPPPAPNDDQMGWEVTRPGVPMPTGTGGSDSPQAGWIRCTLTGRYFPPSEIIYLEGKPYCADAKPRVMASLQSGGYLPTSDDGRDGPAWEKRQQLGFMKAIWETIKCVLLQPSQTFSTMKREGGLQEPLVFNLIVGSVSMIVFQVLVGFVQIAVLSAAASQNSGPSAAGVMAGGVFGMIFGIVMAPIQLAIGAFVGSGILHVCLMLVKGAQRPFETTFRVVNYGQGALMALYLVPVLGWLALLPWYFIVMIIGTAKAHEISNGKAALAVLLPMIVCCGLGIILAVAFGALGALSGTH